MSDNHNVNEKKRKSSVVIKRITKVNGGHHGGAWKVAFADFAISMMALFLVLWVMGTTTEEERQQLTSSVNNILEFDGSSALLEGTDGNSVLDLLTEHSEALDAQQDGSNEALARQSAHYESQAQLGQLAENLTATLKDLKVSDNVVIEVVEQGVRVRFQDQAKKPLFARSSRELSDDFITILRSLGPIFSKINNKVMLSGHSDATPLNNAFYSNWELSTERAISARHVLVQNGMPSEQVIQLAGYADAIPIQGKDPLDPVNRRIEILILTDKGETALKNLFKNSAAPPAATTVQ